MLETLHMAWTAVQTSSGGRSHSWQGERRWCLPLLGARPGRPWVSVIGSGGTGLPGRLLPHLGADYMGPRGGNASSCTLDTCVLIHVYFTV